LYYRKKLVLEGNLFINQSFPGNLWSASGSMALQYGTEGKYWFGLVAGGGRQLYYYAGLSPVKRYAVLSRNKDTVLKRDDAAARLLVLLVRLGYYDQAIELVTKRHFRIWEGGTDVHELYVNAYLLRGGKYLDSKKYAEALADFRAADRDLLELGLQQAFHGQLDVIHQLVDDIVLPDLHPLISRPSMAWMRSATSRSCREVFSRPKRATSTFFTAARLE
jgi:tetratricopeptide (TPR) repeat protein